MDNWVGFQINKFEYASEYSKQEVKEKVKTAKQKAKAEGCPTVRREKSREHTPSKIYAYCTLLMSAVFLVCLIVAWTVADAHVLLIIILLLTFIVMLCASGLFFLRAILVKRIGIVHRSESTTYQVEEVYN